jgi:hypothetical protein
VSQLHVRGDRIALTQEFREGSYCCKSAVAVTAVGQPASARFLDESQATLTAVPGTILIATAASFDPNEDVAAAAFRLLDAAAAKGFAVIAGETAD